jgi:hypothetical protein
VNFLHSFLAKMFSRRSLRKEPLKVVHEEQIKRLLGVVQYLGDEGVIYPYAVEICQELRLRGHTMQETELHDVIDHCVRLRYLEKFEGPKELKGASPSYALTKEGVVFIKCMRE